MNKFTIGAILTRFLLPTLSLLLLNVEMTLASTISYTDFSSIVGLNIQGNAARVGSVLRLAPGIADQRGSAWFNVKQQVQQGFDTVFQFRISGKELGWAGADGLAFVIQNASMDALGGNGHYTGYGGITNSLAIQFGNWDPGSDRWIQITTGGTGANYPDAPHQLAIDSAVPDFTDGGVHTAEISYDGETLSVRLDSLATPLVSVTVDLGSTLSLDDGQAWVGLTAATGADWQNHDIKSWQFTPVPEPSTWSLLALGVVALVGGLRLRRRS